jgi:hypothetical protein
MNKYTEQEKRTRNQRDCNKVINKDYILNPSLNLANELLKTILNHEKENVLVKLNDFRDSIGKGIEDIGTLKVVVDNYIIIELGQKLEISIDGYVENQLGTKEVFTLFFYLWRNNEKYKDNYKIKDSSNEQRSFLIDSNDTKKKLSDSVFALTLSKDEEHGSQDSMDYGRGFLKFGVQHFCSPC